MNIRSLQPQRGLALKIWRLVWTPIVILLAFVPLGVANLFQMSSIVLLPFSRRLFRAYNRRIAAAIWGYWAAGVQRVIGLRVDIAGDRLPMHEDAIVIANHQEMGDIIAVLCLAYAQGRAGDCKWMVKDVIKYVPGVGWGMVFLDCLFLKRNWADDEDKIRQTFSRYINGRVPLWMVSFPEGTRFKPAKLQASQEFARKAGLPLPQHVLIPRARGFVASVHGLRTHIKAVYSVTIAYDGKVPTLLQLFRGDVGRVRMHVQRTPIDKLPADDKQVGEWLLADFQRQDRLLATLQQTAEPAKWG